MTDEAQIVSPANESTPDARSICEREGHCYQIATTVKPGDKKLPVVFCASCGEAKQLKL